MSAKMAEGLLALPSPKPAKQALCKPYLSTDVWSLSNLGACPRAVLTSKSYLTTDVSFERPTYVCVSYLKLEVSETNLLNVAAYCRVCDDRLPKVQPVKGRGLPCVVQAYQHELVLFVWKPIAVK